MANYQTITALAYFPLAPPMYLHRRLIALSTPLDVDPCRILCFRAGMSTSAVGDCISERSGCLGARLLQSINSESIMAGRAILASREM
jgi:hypothetical protein